MLLKKKIISFCLWGDKPIYTIGCLKNAKLLTKFFKDWTMRVYYNDTVHNDIIKELQNLGVETVEIYKDSNFLNSLWRYLPITDKTVERFISRDCDSRISERDEIAVNEWIESGKTFHIIRDHPVGHSWGINAGMFGAKGGSIPQFFELLNKYLKDYLSDPSRVYDRYIDQCFLRDIIHPMTVGDLLLHDEFFNKDFNGEGQGIKIKRERLVDKFSFIGECIDENDIPIEGQRIAIIHKYYEHFR